MTNVVALATTMPDWMVGLDFVPKANGQMDPGSLKNASLMLEHHPRTKGMFAYDEFRDQVVLTRGLDGGKGYPRPITDGDDTALSCWLDTQKIRSKITNTAAVVRELARRHSFDPLSDWLRGLAWDGVPRCERWLVDHAGAPDAPYVRAVSLRFVISAVARALKPGSKVDTMLVLEGEQGIRKSSMVRALAGEEFFSDQLGDVRSKDSAELIQGRWIVEVGEMDRVLRVESSAVKDFLSKQEDRYRPPYGRNVVSRPRRCVFMGTINPMDGTGYLRDPTGARRFWPVPCGSEVAIDDIKLEREQIWAEAVHRWRKGERWWLEGEEVVDAKEQQASRYDEDVWGPRVTEWLDERQASGKLTFSSAEILSGLGVETARQEHKHKIRIASTLHSLGVRQGYGLVAGKNARVWVLGEAK